MDASKPWHNPGKWFTSPYNYEPAVLDQMPNLPKRVYIKDATLREGEETPGVIFTSENRIELALKLQEIGVAEIQIPTAASVDESRELLKAFREAGISCRLSGPGVFRRPPYIGDRWKEETQRIAELSLDSVSMTIAFSGRDLASDFAGELTKERICEMTDETVRYAKSLGVSVGYGWPSVTRTCLQTAKMFYRVAVEAGADRIRMYDTFGGGTPAGVRYLVSEVRKVVGELPILFHCHDDFGMATANTLAAIEGGANWCDVVVNGLGDRAGNAPLEEVVAALEILRGVDTGIKMEELCALSSLVEKMSRVKPQPNKAIIGTNAFLEESAPHYVQTVQAAQQGSPEWAAPYAPELVGQRRKLVFGSTTLYGGAIEFKLDEWGIKYSPEDIERVRQSAWQKIEQKRFITEDEFYEVCRTVLGV